MNCPTRVSSRPGMIRLLPLSILVSLLLFILPAWSNPDDFYPIITDMVDSVSVERYTGFMQSLVDFGTRNTLHDNCDSAAQYIQEQFESFGLDDVFTIEFELQGHTRRTVVGEITGLVYPDSVYIVMAHYDATAGESTVPEPVAPGACDNASGAACVLECARILADYPFKCTVQFAAFAGEEQGGWGSQAYVQYLLEENLAVAGACNFDMISYTGSSALPLEFETYHDGNSTAEMVAEKMAEAAAAFRSDEVTCSVINDPSANVSDHYWFWEEGWPATYTRQCGVTYAWYHSIYDTMGNNDMEYGANITACVLAAVADLADPFGAAVPIAGSVSGTWTLEDSPYYVADSIWVPDNAALTIEPGVIVLFEDGVKFKVLDNAVLHAVGTVDAPIVFNALDDAVGWGGIRFLSCSDNSWLEFCHLRNGRVAGFDEDNWGGALYCDDARPFISHCIIDYCAADKGGAIACVNQSNPMIEFCTLYSNSASEGNGIYCADSSPIIANCILWDDAGGEIALSGSSDPEVLYCDVRGGWGGAGNFDADPCFADAAGGDYHLQSEAGRYERMEWIADTLHSPCIDAGDPAFSCSEEPEPNGDLINIGVYGNTVQASLSIADPHYAVGAVAGLWTAADNSPMYIYAPVYVPVSDELTIEAGVDVIFLGQYTFEVREDATLEALGTPEDSVTFRAAEETNWCGLRLLDASDNCRLQYCHLTGSQTIGNGGAVYAENGGLTVEHCRFDNCNGLSGGAIYANGSTVVIRNCIFSDNTGNNGGALNLWSCAGEVTNNVFDHNTANGQGGAIFLFNLSQAPVLQNNTICDNSANQGGGVHNSGTVEVTLLNVILWGNTPEQIVQGGGPAIQVTYSNVQGGWSGSGNLDEEPDFTGGTLSGYQLGDDSPCIDTGDPDAAYDDPEDPANPGFAAWPAQGMLRNDMGAYGGPGASWPVVAVEEFPGLTEIPRSFHLMQNYPNPFNPTTVASFELRVASNVHFAVYDITGREVARLVDGWRNAGLHEVMFDGSGLASGMYIYRLTAGEFTGVGKMVLLK